MVLVKVVLMWPEMFVLLTAIAEQVYMRLVSIIEVTKVSAASFQAVWSIVKCMCPGSEAKRMAPKNATVERAEINGMVTAAPGTIGEGLMSTLQVADCHAAGIRAARVASECVHHSGLDATVKDNCRTCGNV